VDDLLARVARDGHIPGLAVAVLRDGAVVKSATYGQADIENGTQVSAATRFQIASATKLFTSTLLLRMVANGKIGLDDPVTRTVPGAPPAWRAIRVRDLAAHLSGLGSPNIGPEVVRTADAVSVLEKAKLAGPPGAAARYDSLDYTLLQLILERAGGEPFAALLHDRLLAPAGLTCTGFDDAERLGPQLRADPVPHRAEYYHWNGRVNQRSWFLYTQYAYAAGGAYSCVSDMARLLALADTGQLLPAPLLQQAWTPPVLKDGTAGEFGIGWVVKNYRGQRWVGHSGGPAFSDVMYFPALRLGIVVLTNQQRLYPQLASLVADQFIPAPAFYNDAGMKDAKPALTDRARRFLLGAAAGSVDSALLLPSIRKDAAEDWNGAGPGWLGLLGPLTRMVLVRESAGANGGTTRFYRVFYGAHAQGFRFAFDAAGAIEDADAADTM
jgi:CubicO group peptidase (beta-lactamase class C family)